MEWLEIETLPMECQDCQEEECYNCDHAGRRWRLSKRDGLLLRRKGLVKAMERLQQQIEEIDRELRENT